MIEGPYQALLRPLAVFIVGFTSGFLASAYVRSADDASVRRSIAFLITFVWILTILTSIFVPTYETPLAVHGVMGAVAGYLFAKDTGLIPGMSRPDTRDFDDADEQPRQE